MLSRKKKLLEKTSSKIFEFNHETFVGQIIKQSTMKAHFPTFRGHENYSYWDYEQGITLFDYLKRGSCESGFYKVLLFNFVEFYKCAKMNSNLFIMIYIPGTSC